MRVVGGGVGGGHMLGLVLELGDLEGRGAKRCIISSHGVGRSCCNILRRHCPYLPQCSSLTELNRNLVPWRVLHFEPCVQAKRAEHLISICSRVPCVKVCFSIPVLVRNCNQLLIDGLHVACQFLVPVLQSFLS